MDKSHRKIALSKKKKKKVTICNFLPIFLLQ